MAVKIGDLFLGSKGFPVTRGFAAHPKYGCPGVDYACPNKTKLLACFNGVAQVGTNPAGKDWGNYIWLKSTEDTRYKAGYAHLYKAAVKNGARVIRGQLLAYSDNSGLSTGPHLHFSVSVNGTCIDPAKLPWLIKNPTKPVVPGVVSDMYTDKSGIFNVTLSAARWNASAVRYYKDYKAQAKKVATLTAQVAKLKKDNEVAWKKTAADYQTAIENLSKKVHSLEDQLTTLRAGYDDALQASIDAHKVIQKSKEIMGLHEADSDNALLKALQTLTGASKKPAPPKESDWALVIVWKALKNLFRRAVK